MENAKQKILIIEDDKDIAALEKDFLEINGFEAIMENDGVKGAEHALSNQFSLILLDLMLPGKDGISICREIRAKIDIPILMVTARNEDVDKVRGLGIGANEIDFGWFQINHATHRVFVNGSEITIANKEYELLYFLGLHAEMVFSKEQLYDRIWGEDMYGEIKTVSSRGQIRKCGRPPYSVEV